jgi:hypothetical protein
MEIETLYKLIFVILPVVLVAHADAQVNGLVSSD